MRPVVALSLGYGNKHASCYAIIDSGADNCAFPLPFAFALGINVLACPQEFWSGLGGYGVPAYQADILVGMIGTNIVFKVRAGFTEGLNVSGFGLLGQDGFFNQFLINFDLATSGSFQIEVP